MTDTEITREQFIAKYTNPEPVMNRAGRYAIPCDCGEDICEGWQYGHADDINSFIALAVVSPTPPTDAEELEARLDEAEAQLAYIGAGCYNASREELVKRITAVGTERFKVGDWLAERLEKSRAEGFRAGFVAGNQEQEK